jgi:hypothetical protein
MSESVIKGGSFNAVELVDGKAVKTTHTLMRRRQVRRVQAWLHDYAVALEREPIVVARLLDSSVVRTRRGAYPYKLRHTVEAADGQNVATLSRESKRTALTDIIGQLCAMSFISAEQCGTLQVPVDATLHNWQLHHGRPTLVDIYPPLIRDEQGSMVFFERRDEMFRAQRERDFADLTNIVPYMLLENAPLAAREPLVDWCADTLPGGVDAGLRNLIIDRVEQRAPFYCLPSLKA